MQQAKSHEGGGNKEQRHCFPAMFSELDHYLGGGLAVVAEAKDVLAGRDALRDHDDVPHRLCAGGPEDRQGRQGRRQNNGTARTRRKKTSLHCIVLHCIVSTTSRTTRTAVNGTARTRTQAVPRLRHCIVLHRITTTPTTATAVATTAVATTAATQQCNTNTTNNTTRT